MKNLADSLLKSYAELKGSIPVETRFQLNKNEIAELIDGLRNLMFPGYFSNSNINDLLNETQDILSKYAAAETEEFLANLPKIRERIATDVEAAYDGDPAAVDKEEIIISYPGLYAITVYRLAHELYLLKVPMLPRIMTEHAHSITGIDIHPGAEIGNYFFIDHGTGIVIGETTIIGEHVKIYQGVTLGALSTRGGQTLKGKKRHPTVEDNVTIYSGASVFGGNTVIGKGAVLGSSVFITESVPPGSKLTISQIF